MGPSSTTRWRARRRDAHGTQARGRRDPKLSPLVERARRLLRQPGAKGSATRDYNQAEDFRARASPRPKNSRRGGHGLPPPSRNENGGRELLARLRREMPNDVGVHFVSGVMRRLDGDYDRALRSFDRMVKLNPAERVVVSYNRARIFMYQRRFEDALMELDQGAAMEPDHPLIKTFRAACFTRGRSPDGQALLEEVRRRTPPDGVRDHYATCEREGEARGGAGARPSRSKDVAADDNASLTGSHQSTRSKRTGTRRSSGGARHRLGNENKKWFESDRTGTVARRRALPTMMETRSVATQGGVKKPWDFRRRGRMQGRPRRMLRACSTRCARRGADTWSFWA